MASDKYFLKVTDAHKRTTYINLTLVRSARLQPSSQGQGMVLEMKFDDKEALTISDPPEITRITKALDAVSL